MKSPLSCLFSRLNRPSSLTLYTDYSIPTLDSSMFSDLIITGQRVRSLSGVPCGVSRAGSALSGQRRCHARTPGRGRVGAVPPCPGRSGRSPHALSRRWRVLAQCGGLERCCCRQPGGCGPRDEPSAPRRDGEPAAAAAA